MMGYYKEVFRQPKASCIYLNGSCIFSSSCLIFFCEPRQRCVGRSPRIIEAMSSSLVRTSAAQPFQKLRVHHKSSSCFFSSQPMLLSSKVPCSSSTAAYHRTVIFSVYASEESEMGYFKSLSYFQCTNWVTAQLDTVLLNRLCLLLYPLPYCDFAQS